MPHRGLVGVRRDTFDVGRRVDAATRTEVMHYDCRRGRVLPGRRAVDAAPLAVEDVAPLPVTGQCERGQRASVRLFSEEDEVVHDITPGWDPALYDWVSIELTPGVYRGLAIDLVPHPNAQRLDPLTGLMETSAGRLRIHALDIYAIPGPAEDGHGRVARLRAPEGNG